MCLPVVVLDGQECYELYALGFEQFWTQVSKLAEEGLDIPGLGHRRVVFKTVSDMEATLDMGGIQNANGHNCCTHCTIHMREHCSIHKGWAQERFHTFDRDLGKIRRTLLGEPPPPSPSVSISNSACSSASSSAGTPGQAILAYFQREHGLVPATAPVPTLSSGRRSSICPSMTMSGYLTRTSLSKSPGQ